MTEGTFTTGMNKIQTQKLKEIAKLLYEKGLIPKSNKYHVNKYALLKLLEAFDVVNTGFIIPIEGSVKTNGKEKRRGNSKSKS